MSTGDIAAVESYRRYREAEAEIGGILERYTWEVAAAALLREPLPPSPLAEIQAISRRALAEFLAG